LGRAMCRSGMFRDLGGTHASGPASPPTVMARRLRRVADHPDSRSPGPGVGSGVGAVVGMVGAGQLARMTFQASISLNIGFRVLAAGPEESAAQVCPAVQFGDYRDLEDLLSFAAGCDVVTFDHEHVPG